MATGPRVLSLLPSATELLCAIGAGELLVGRSHECDFPPEIADRPALTARRTTDAGSASSAAIDTEVRAVLGAEGKGALHTLDAERLRELRPEVILTQDLCAVCSIHLQSVRGAVAAIDPAPAIVSLDPRSIEDLFDDVLRVGEAVGRERAAHRTMVALRDRFWSAADLVTPFVDGPEVAFLEWMAPLFAGGHWTPQLIERAGGRHGLNPAGAASRAITPGELVASRPEALIVCPCGFDLDRTREELGVLTNAPWWHDLPAVTTGRVAIVDGSAMFNRPGPRLVDAFRWLVGWLDGRPEVVPAGFPWEPLPAH